MCAHNLDRDETVSSQIEQMFAAHAGRRALLHRGHWLTFAEVDVHVRGVGSFLETNGVTPGDRVVLYLANSAAFRVVELAALRYGRVRVALSSRLHPREVALVAQDAAARIVFCSAERAAEVRAALHERHATAIVVAIDDADATATEGMELGDFVGPGPGCAAVSQTDLAMILYSSGTTGEPKGATVTHFGWVAQTRLALAQLPAVDQEDVVIAVAPMSHFGGSIGLDCMMRGAATVPLRGFDCASLLAAVKQHEATILPLAPIMLSRLAKYIREARVQAPRLRAIPYGGAPLSEPDLLLAAQTFPASLIQFYGLSEALAPIAALSAADHERATETADVTERSRLLSSAGKIVPGVRARVIDAELSVQADTVTPGYWNRADLNTAVLSSDRWFSTGDVVEIDSEGYLHVLGRGSDVIISGGFNVHAAEVERVLSQIPMIAEVAVFGVPHPIWGMGVAAAVVAREPVVEFARPSPELEEAIRAACAANLAGYKKPTIVRLVNAIPRNSADKIDRNTLQQLFAAQQEGGHASS